MLLFGDLRSHDRRTLLFAKPDLNALDILLGPRDKDFLEQIHALRDPSHLLVQPGNPLAPRALGLRRRLDQMFSDLIRAEQQGGDDQQLEQTGDDPAPDRTVWSKITAASLKNY